MWNCWIKEWFPTVSYDHVFISYLPNKDKEGTEFDVEPWETKTLKIQGRLFRGATSYPSRGSYRKIASEGSITSEVMLEKTRMVVSFVIRKEFTPEALKEITDFLKEFGIKTKQEAVAFVVNGEMYYIEIKK
ncbi:MAG: hypothetical protein HZA12_00150 [Nitrospirae bacterium]|nr:hypothetical protein [Nitrospirota bacterium]